MDDKEILIDCISFDNKEYIIFKEINFLDNNYIYGVNEDDHEIILLKKIIENGKMYVEKVIDQVLIKNVLTEIAKSGL